nr:protein BOBBER 1 [Tanacetum cinerariifolium]
MNSDVLDFGEKKECRIVLSSFRMLLSVFEIYFDSMAVAPELMPRVKVNRLLLLRQAVDDSFWSIESKFYLYSLTKQDQMEWWKCLVKDEPRIDTQKVEAESSKLGDQCQKLSDQRQMQMQHDPLLKR